MNSIGGLSSKGFSEMVQWFDTRRLSSVYYSEGCPSVQNIQRVV